MLFAFYLVDSGVRDISFLAAKKMPCNNILSINNLKSVCIGNCSISILMIRLTRFSLWCMVYGVW
jgi:hypothetical protein